jgi:hypothetical protein
MPLSNAYLVTTKNLEAFLNAIKTAKAPERVNNKFITLVCGFAQKQQTALPRYRFWRIRRTV